MSNKHLLVIGASGMIGSEVCKQARERNMDVVATSAHPVDGLVPYRLDHDNPEDLFRLCGLGGDSTFAVIAGAVTNIKECYDRKDFSYAVNVEGTCRLAEALYRYGIKTIFLSSDAVFDGSRGLWKEDDAPHPICEYGRHKVQAERYLLANIPGILVYRLSKQVSTLLEVNSLFRELQFQAMNNLPIRCISGLRFQPTDVRDTAKCILDGLCGNLSGLYHVANPQPFSRYELTKLFLASLHIRASITECNVKEFDFSEPKPLDTTMDTGKFQSVFHHEFRSMESVINEIAGSQQ